MALNCRFIGPMPSALTGADGEKAEWAWKESMLFKLRRTMKEPKQLPAKNMIQMELVGDNALPGVQSSTTHGPQKYAQFGQECASQIILSAVAP